MARIVHLDTDLGGDIDDLCALAMLLRWEQVEIAGITTVAEAGGRRAGYVRQVLELEGRQASREPKQPKAQARTDQGSGTPLAARRA